MVSEILKKSKIYLLGFIFIGILFFGVSLIFKDYIVKIDNWVINVVRNYVVNDKLTDFMKIVTSLGGVGVFLCFLIVMFLLISNKKVGYYMSINLLIAYIFSVIFKNVFRRSRPALMLITKPSDFSFPSGHTMCSIVFYGFLIYVVNRLIKNVNIKVVINIILVLIMVFVPFSRLYLGVHYFSDVIGGIILGFVCLLSFINYVKIKEIF